MKRRILQLALLLWALVGLRTAVSMATPAKIRVSGLKCEMRVNPLGIDSRIPHLSWQIGSMGRNVVQTGCHILVASTPEKLAAGEGDLWDSGWVDSDVSLYFPYGGRPLVSREACYWKVCVRTNKGTSAWSEPAMWTMGIFGTRDWRGRWTGFDQSFPGDVLKGATRLAARYFRKEFTLRDTPVRKATLYVCGLGLYEAFLNGRRIGDQELAPTLTLYSQEVKYNTFDVTSLIDNGPNAIGITLGNGRFFSMRQKTRSGWFRNFGFPKFILQLDVEYADGKREIIPSDTSWRVTVNGPIRANSEYDGEEYDARMEMPGWTNVGFDDSAWHESELVEPPCFLIRSQMNENICVMDTVRPVSITEPKPGVYVVDMGQNMVGWLQMQVRGKAGDQVKLRFAELLRPDGTLYTDNYREARVTDLYTLRGDGREIWEPTFSYRGFRYAEVTGYPGRPSLDDFLGKVIYDRMETTGLLETSDSTINQVHRNAYWGIRGNYRSMPTDCPQRNERMGWLGDRSVNCHGESFIFDNNGLYAKWMEDIAASQLTDGRISDVAPDYFTRLYYDSMTWPGTYLSVAEMLYRQFGNTEPIRKHYLSMKQWIEYMRNNYMHNDLLPHDRYGDWCMPPESPELIHSKDPARITSAVVLGTTYFYYYLGLMKEFAELLGKTQDAEEFEMQAQRTCDAFNARFFNEQTRYYDNNTITANLLPLRFGMVPEQYRADVFRNIVDKTMNDWNGHISTGVIGTQWLMRSLSDNGRPDIALRLATNRDYPSWGYMVENGATTIWELWNGNTADPSMNSLNHVMLLGDLIVWDYEYLGGIRNAPGSAGFKQILMRPLTQIGLDYVKASYKSGYGQINSSWRHTRQGFAWDISVPCNTRATVYVPASDPDRVREGNRKADGREGVRFLRMESGCAVFEIGSGNYSFSVSR